MRQTLFADTCFMLFRAKRHGWGERYRVRAARKFGDVAVFVGQGVAPVGQGDAEGLLGGIVVDEELSELAVFGAPSRGIDAIGFRMHFLDGVEEGLLLAKDGERFGHFARVQIFGVTDAPAV